MVSDLSQLCNPCAIKYDFIGKFEHIKEDSVYALRWMLGAKTGEEEVDVLPEAVHPTAASSFTYQYLKQLDAGLREGVLAKYLLDYISFDYSFIEETELDKS